MNTELINCGYDDHDIFINFYEIFKDPRGQADSTTFSHEGVGPLRDLIGPD